MTNPQHHIIRYGELEWVFDETSYLLLPAPPVMLRSRYVFTIVIAVLSSIQDLAHSFSGVRSGVSLPLYCSLLFAVFSTSLFNVLTSQPLDFCFLLLSIFCKKLLHIQYEYQTSIRIHGHYRQSHPTATIAAVLKKSSLNSLHLLLHPQYGVRLHKPMMIPSPNLTSMTIKPTPYSPIVHRATHSPYYYSRNSSYI